MFILRGLGPGQAAGKKSGPVNFDQFKFEEEREEGGGGGRDRKSSGGSERQRDEEEG